MQILSRDAGLCAEIGRQEKRRMEVRTTDENYSEKKGRASPKTDAYSRRKLMEKRQTAWPSYSSGNALSYDEIALYTDGKRGLLMDATICSGKRISEPAINTLGNAVCTHVTAPGRCSVRRAVHDLYGRNRLFSYQYVEIIICICSVTK